MHDTFATRTYIEKDLPKMINNIMVKHEFTLQTNSSYLSQNHLILTFLHITRQGVHIIK